MSWVGGVTHRIEAMDKKYSNTVIALSVLGISLISFVMDYVGVFLIIAVDLQILATAALLFATFKKDPLHKDKFILFWLIITAIMFSVWIFLGFQYLFIDFTSYDFFDFITSLAVLLCIWLGPVLIGFMMYLIYKEYAKLVQSNRNTMLATNPMPEIVQTKEMPPPYIAPTSENVSVSITSQTINV